MPIFKLKWKQLYNAEEDYFKRQSAEDPFPNWEKDHMPEAGVDFILSNAFLLLCADAPAPLSNNTLKRCVAIAKRALAENKLESDLCKNGFPLNRAELLRAQAFAFALMGKPFKKELLLNALEDFFVWIKNNKTWWVDDPFQSYYLSAVKLALFTENFEKASNLVTHKKVKFHKAEVRLLRFLAKKGYQARENKAFVDAFNRFFDKKRNPDKAGSNIYLLELGALRDKFLISKNGEIDWQRVIHDISN